MLSPGSTNPASSEYIRSGQLGPRPSSNRSPFGDRHDDHGIGSRKMLRSAGGAFAYPAGTLRGAFDAAIRTEPVRGVPAGQRSPRGDAFTLDRRQCRHQATDLDETCVRKAGVYLLGLVDELSDCRGVLGGNQSARSAAKRGPRESAQRTRASPGRSSSAGWSRGTRTGRPWLVARSLPRHNTIDRLRGSCRAASPDRIRAARSNAPDRNENAKFCM